MEETVQTWLERALEIYRAPLFEVADVQVTIESLVLATIFFLVTLLVSAIVRRAVGKAFAARGVTDEGTVGVPQRLLHYAILIVGITIILHNLGLNLSALFAAGAVFAIAIGFAFQNIAQNFVAGVILLVERAIKPGDVVEIDGGMARVIHMGLRATVVRTLDEEELIVPNTNLVQTTVQNFTLRDDLYRLRTLVGVVYSTDLDRAIEVLTTAAASVPDRDSHRSPVVLLREFGDSSINFDVSIWIHDPWNHRKIRSALNLALWRGLKEAGITIAFPQLDVHFDPEVVERLGAPRAATREE